MHTHSHRMSSNASGSTWSLERLDALTSEIKDLIMSRLGSWQDASTSTTASSSHKSDATSFSTAPAQPTAESAVTTPPEEPQAAPNAATDFQTDSPTPTTANNDSTSPQQQQQPTASTASDHSSLQLPPGLFEAYPFEVIASINEILYSRHGYMACNRYGNVR